MQKKSSRNRIYGITTVVCSTMILALILNAKSDHGNKSYRLHVDRTMDSPIGAGNTAITDSNHALKYSMNTSIHEESLATELEVKYFAQIDKFFGQESAKLDEAIRKQEIAAINRFGNKGVASILKRLVALERNDKEAIENISLVDYASYRLRWDPNLRQDIAAIVSSKIPDSVSLRSRASLIAERAELVRGLGASDKDLAVKTVESINDQKLKAYAMESLLESFMDDGLDYSSALERMRQEFPNYTRKEMAPPEKVRG